eukprot:jgi/Hompol1/6361/HPOL_004963-RA
MSKNEKRPTTKTDKLDKPGGDRDKGGKSTRPDSASLLSQSKTGTFIFKDGSRYEGEYKEIETNIIVRSGQGRYTCGATKNVYMGAWDTDKMHGKGDLVD